MFLSNQLKLFVYYIILFYWSIVDLQCILFSDVQQSDSVMCVYTHTHMYIYTHTHAHIYIYTFSDSKLKLLMSLPSLSSMPSWKPQAALIFSLSPRWTLELEGYFLSIFFCFHYAHDLVHQLVNWSPCFSPLLYSTPEIWGLVEGGLSTPQPGLERLWVFVLF